MHNIGCLLLWARKEIKAETLAQLLYKDFYDNETIVSKFFFVIYPIFF